MSQYDQDKQKSGMSQDERKHQGDIKHGKNAPGQTKNQNQFSKDKKHEDRSGRREGRK